MLAVRFIISNHLFETFQRFRLKQGRASAAYWSLSDTTFLRDPKPLLLRVLSERPNLIRCIQQIKRDGTTAARLPIDCGSAAPAMASMAQQFPSAGAPVCVEFIARASIQCH